MSVQVTVWYWSCFRSQMSTSLPRLRRVSNRLLCLMAMRKASELERCLGSAMLLGKLWGMNLEKDLSVG